MQPRVAKVTYTLRLQHIDKLLLVWESSLLSPQSKACHVTQVLRFSCAGGAHV